MLEIRLSTLKSFLKYLAVVFIPLWIGLIIGGIKLLDIEDISSFLIGSSIGGIIIFSYLYARYFVEKRALENYLTTLRNRQFRDALSYGRIYYGVKRNGFRGANGNSLTINDESAINNDINAYSRA